MKQGCLAALLLASYCLVACSDPAPDASVDPEPAASEPVPEAATPFEQAERSAASVMERFRTESPNEIYDDGVYAELPRTDLRDARLVRCTVSTTGQFYRGPCYFLAEGGGGFSLYRPDGGPLSEGVTLVTLAKTGETSGEVRGLTMDGINSRWGAADRSEADPACWTGSDFEVCAYGL